MTEIMQVVMGIYCTGVTLCAMKLYNEVTDLKVTNRYYGDWIDKQLTKSEKRHEKR